MSAPAQWWATPFGKPRENRFDALTDEEREQIINSGRVEVTKCPPVTVAQTFRQQLGRTP